MVTTDLIKELRESTGVSVMQCKKALEEAGGDVEKALVILRKKSGELSAKKADRKFNAGTVQSYIHSNGTLGVMLELNCESDFVAKSSDFKNLSHEICLQIAALKPLFVSEDQIPAEVLDGEFPKEKKCEKQRF